MGLLFLIELLGFLYRNSYIVNYSLFFLFVKERFPSLFFRTLLIHFPAGHGKQ